ncbi:hypothetical protein ACFQL1_09915 [Halomicroarcula sp. GCM10025709]|uniref:hypothetical protein n=1 Tax=Halomicroarcula sp. GCM10025709 TaxID=3252669 RepID=UPI0036212FA9
MQCDSDLTATLWRNPDDPIRHADPVAGDEIDDVREVTRVPELSRPGRRLPGRDDVRPFGVEARTDDLRLRRAALDDCRDRQPDRQDERTGGDEYPRIQPLRAAPIRVTVPLVACAVDAVESEVPERCRCDYRQQPFRSQKQLGTGPASECQLGPLDRVSDHTDTGTESGDCDHPTVDLEHLRDNLVVPHRRLTGRLIGDRVRVPSGDVPVLGGPDDPVCGQPTILNLLGLEDDHVARLRWSGERAGDRDEPVVWFERRIHAPGPNEPEQDGLSEQLPDKQR